MRTCYQNIWRTRLSKFKVLFSLCSDNMSAWNVTRTDGKPHFLNSECGFHLILITCLHEMISEHKENNTFQIQSVVFRVFWYGFMQTCYQNTRKTTRSKPHVSETIVITMCCTSMLSEPMENNTFQAQSVRNLWNNTYFNLPGYLFQPPANFFYPPR